MILTKCKQIYLPTAFAITLLAGCQKAEGPGGSSAIRGTLTGYSHDAPRAEVTDVICVEGSSVENGDYWILNNVAGATQYYIWYKNPQWVGGDPALVGRTGIEVGFNYSDDNVTIASNTAAAISAAVGSDFTLTLQTDIIRITASQSGDIPDANEMDSNFQIDVATQGATQTLSGLSTIVDERVYIVYGDNEFYGDNVRTDHNGQFEFSGLTKGSYTVFAYSQDTLNPGQLLKTEVAVEITENKQIVEAPALVIVD